MASWLLTVSFGCAAGNYSGGNANSDARPGRPSDGGNGSIIGPAQEASGGASVDAHAREVLAANLSEDAPTFNWQPPVSGTGGTIAATGGATGSARGGTVATGGAIPAGGIIAAGGATTTGNGGAMPAGGASGAMAAGGSTVRGGSPANGGAASTGRGGGATAAGGATTSPGSSPPSGGATGFGGRTAGGGSGGGSLPSPDAGISADAPSAPFDVPPRGDALAPDVSSRDSGGFDATPVGTPPDGRPSEAEVGSTLPCSTRIRALVPISLDRLVASANSQVVLRAEILSGGPSSVSGWTWRAWFGATPLAPAGLGREDTAAAAFRLANPGSYTFSVTDASGACSATVYPNAFPANACPECDRSAIVRAAPPPSASIPVQTGAVMLLGPSPFAQNNIVLAQGVSVSVAPSVGNSIVVSYVRILNGLGAVVADGLADQQSAFISRLLAVNSGGDVLRYNILVVPVDGREEETINATAPQLFPQLTPAAVNTTAFRLMNGVTVVGQTTASDDSAIPGARVVLSNRDPKDKTASSDLLFSSVGRSNDQGTYQLQVQAGDYWVTASPPADSGLTEAVSSSSLSVSVGTKLGVHWDAPATVAVTLNVTDAQGNSLAGAKVTLSTAQARKVGTFSLQPLDSPGLSMDAYGSVRSEGTTSSTGSVTFDRLPSNTVYQAVIQPDPVGPFATTTTTTVVVSSTAANRTIAARAAAQISGVLLPASTTVALDLSRVTIAAYDKSDDAIDAPRFVNADSDGAFSLSVTPDRPYVLLAIPPLDSAYARTFVGLGPLTATEFPLSQTLPLSMEWRAQVLDETQDGVSSTALQVFCGATWPTCVDPTIPLAETTSEVDGTFRLPLPDPTSR